MKRSMISNLAALSCLLCFTATGVYADIYDQSMQKLEDHFRVCAKEKVNNIPDISDAQRSNTVEAAVDSFKTSGIASYKKYLMEHNINPGLVDQCVNAAINQDCALIMDGVGLSALPNECQTLLVN